MAGMIGAERVFVAVASSDGKRVQEPLGVTDYLSIYDMAGGEPKLSALRFIPPRTGDDQRAEKLSELLRDCRVLIAGGIGALLREALVTEGLVIRTARGRVADVLTNLDLILAGEIDVPFVCPSAPGDGSGGGCGCGDGGGCGAAGCGGSSHEASGCGGSASMQFSAFGEGNERGGGCFS